MNVKRLKEILKNRKDDEIVLIYNGEWGLYFDSTENNIGTSDIAFSEDFKKNKHNEWIPLKKKVTTS